MKPIEKIKMRKVTFLVFVTTLFIIPFFLFTACNKEEMSDPPVIKVFVNNIDVTEAPTTYFPAGTRIEYRFEISASATISDIKTVVFDISIPTAKKTKEVLVGGLPDSLNEIVKGVVFASIDTEIMLVVKDLDGNEVSKSFTVIVQ